MTSITRNLPWFVHDLGVSVIGHHCYASLVENLNMNDVQCLKYALSKSLGIGIVVGGSIMKIPQLMLILSARSARGLSLPAYIIETLAYAITLAYSFRNDFPFSTYGENLFLAIQNTLITLLIIYYPTPSLRRSQDIRARLLVACFATFVSAIALYVLPKEALALLQLATLPLSVFSKLPQILQNSRAQSTGQLSAFAVISQIAGCIARLFTTATEVGDLLVTASFTLALLLNCIVGAQMWIYWGKDEREKDSDLGRPSLVTKEEKESLDIVKPVRSPAGSYVPQQHSASGRKWARKVD